MIEELQRRDGALRKELGDVPLRHAMIAWNVGKKAWNSSGEFGDGRVFVIPHPDKYRLDDRLGLRRTTGACWVEEWKNASPTERLARLMVEAWHIVCRDGVSLKDMHEALLVIPEYRDTLSGDFCIMTDQAATHV
jgi:hypothetical protein